MWLERAARHELVELLTLLDKQSAIRARPSAIAPEVPLILHARYTRAEIVAALGMRDGLRPMVPQAGLVWVPQAASDVFFVDLQKAERDYSPTTMYRDYAINRELFHWESQTRQPRGVLATREAADHHPPTATTARSQNSWLAGRRRTSPADQEPRDHLRIAVRKGHNTPDFRRSSLDWGSS